MKPGTIKRGLLNALLVSISTILVLLLLEVIFRVFKIGEAADVNVMNLNEDSILLPSDNPRLLYTLKPGIPGVSNSQGFHDREYTLEKPEEKIRIVALGDSVAFGVGKEIGLQGNFLGRLEEEDQDVEIINLSMSGYNTIQEVELFMLKGLAFRPDAVWLFYVLNDPDHESKELTLIGKEHLLQRNRVREMSIIGWIGTHSNLLNWFYLRHFSYKLKTKIDVMIMNELASGETEEKIENYYQYMHLNKFLDPVIKRLVDLQQLSQEKGFRLTVFIVPELKDPKVYENRIIHDKVTRALTAVGIPVVDMLPVLDTVNPMTIRLTRNDTLHLNPKGHEIFSDWLAPYLRREKAAAKALMQDPAPAQEPELRVELPSRPSP
jgi:lysophospholipase L1-like esterase